jgi:magnesium chelatase family protein
MTGAAAAAGTSDASGASAVVTVSDRSPVRVGQARGMCLVGVDGVPVTVECDISRGLPGMSIGGLGDTAVNQARDRVRSAMINSGLAWPKSRVVMSLSPAALPKSGSGFDLPMVLAVLSAQGMVAGGAPGADPTATVVIGELGLTGEVRPVPGVLPMLLAARGAGAVRAAVPAGNAAEAARVDGMDITGLDHLDQLLPWAHGALDAPVADLAGAAGEPVAATPSRVPDLSEVSGQPAARRALEVAAAGGHHLWLTGPPGSGKSMLAERLPGILPPLTDAERTETAAVHSVAAEQGNLPAVWSGRRRSSLRIPP